MTANDILRVVKPSLDSYANRVAMKLEQDAKKNAPVRTGALRDSIKAEVGSDGRLPKIELSANVDYAIFIEMGTRYMGAQPFLRPAALNRANYR